MVGGRPKKTAEELDAEMNDYFLGSKPAENGTATAQAGANTAATAAQPADDDIDMVE